MALRWSLRAGYRPPFVHPVGSQKGRLKCFPVGARVTGLPLRGFLTSPLPGPARPGLASPGGFGLCRSASGAPLPGRWGSPPFVFAPSSFPLFRAGSYVSRSLGYWVCLALMWVSILAQDWSNNSLRSDQLFVLSLGPQQNLHDSCCAVSADSNRNIGRK